MIDDELSFRISTGLKDIIGRDLITDDYIAIFELVKNSYDANAKNVVIKFDDNKITLSDDGKGMDLTDLKKKWLFVAYSAKKDGTEDQIDLDENQDVQRISYRDKIQEKKYYAGAKGIGRFSCDRLGNNLILTSQKVTKLGIEQIDIDWTKFNGNQNEDFVKVKVPHRSIRKYNVPFPNKSKNGTILEIFNLSGKWEREKIKFLKHSLEKLINPFSETNDFNIEIICDRYLETDRLAVDDDGKRIIERDKINGPVRNSILEILNIKTTQIEVVITGEIINTKLFDRGTLIYHIQEKNYYKTLIDNLKINLYFLNRSAKLNFGKKMGIQPVQYGSVFLFKNGFRVQPYGNTGDDSWGLDFRSQQGYNRFLSTRDLFGRVDITTENAEQFKEVSSRDGGLVETFGYTQLMDAFKEMGLKRLERYVVGVLWGEAFLRKKYFTSDSEGKKLRESLEKDKDSENYLNAQSNVGSKIDFIQLIKSLSDDKNVKIIEYDKNLVDLVNDNLEEVQPKFLKDLEKIAETTNDNNLKNQIILTEQNFLRLEKEKEAAEKKALDEEKLRKEAEKRAKDAEEKKRKAEDKAKIEEEKRRQAEFDTERKEKERYKAELDKLKAEQKAKEEEDKRKIEEEKNKDLRDELSFVKQENQYLNSTRKTLTGDDAEQLVHSIDLYVGNASSFLNTFFENEDNLNDRIKEELYFVKSNLDKALKVSSIIIKSNFDYKDTNHKIDLAKYIEEYFEDTAIARKSILNIKVKNSTQHIAYLSTIDIDIIIDNLVSNSIKAGSHNILVELKAENSNLLMNYYDDGNGLSEKLLKNPKALFKLGVRDSDKKGSGIGMYDIFKRMEESKGTIEALGNNLKLKGAAFKLKFD